MPTYDGIRTTSQKEDGNDKGKYLTNSSFRELPAHVLHLGINNLVFLRSPVNPFLLGHFNDTAGRSGACLFISLQNLWQW